MTPIDHKERTRRRTTMVFRRFRDKNTALSRLYWTSEAGRHAIRTVLNGRPNGDLAVQALGVTFDSRHLRESVGEIIERLDERAGSERLHLLVICCANLESFLQDAIELWVAHLGHRSADYRLTAVGKALASPVVDRSTVPDMLEYVEQLLDVRFATHLTDWRRGYKLRCAAAHEAGVMSVETAKKLGGVGAGVGDWIKVSWDELKALMTAAHAIAESIDRKLSSAPLREFEVEWTLAQWKREKRLPPLDKVWTVMHELGVTIQRPRQRAIERWLYT